MESNVTRYFYVTLSQLGCACLFDQKEKEFCFW